MVYRGHIQRGVVVLDDAANLPDGTPVTVRIGPQASDVAGPKAGTPEAVLAADISWVGDATELDTLLAEVQRLREDDIELQKRREE